MPNPNLPTYLDAIDAYNNKRWTSSDSRPGPKYVDCLDPDVEFIMFNGGRRRGRDKVVRYLKNKAGTDIERFHRDPSTELWSTDQNTVVGFAGWEDNDGAGPAPTPPFPRIAFIFEFNGANNKLKYLFATPD